VLTMTKAINKINLLRGADINLNFVPAS
jgi:hypothetical protein